MKDIWTGFDFDSFWEQSDYATKNYICKSVSTRIVSTVYKELGYRLPESYINFMQFQNGGIPKYQSVQAADEANACEIAISGLFGIGDEKQYSLLGTMGSKFMLQEWGYPDIGIYFADTPSAGHEMICLDYREHGKNEIPSVAHVDQENDYLVTQLAPNFESFVHLLRVIEDDENLKGVNTTFVWNPKAIQYEMDRSPFSEVMPHQQLRITLTLHPEPGNLSGNMSRFDIPESWASAELSIIKNDFVIDTSTGVYRVRKALEYGARKVILSHCHPGSSIATPSVDDLKTTDKLVSAFSVLDIKVLDHIIVSGSNTYSFVENSNL